ncbi:hypothetical protein GCM10022197_42210 [Microlunatus spumicola]|uniref:Acetyltransferase (GNAT) domain-containing protein n=1 Tax=Microlunatus spumicola TaxID=81499 RepID=A0ABP6YBS4_9ACTN
MLTSALARLEVPDDDEGREQLVSDYFHDYVESSRTGGAFVLHEPRRSIAVMAAALLLPHLQARLDDSPEGREIRDALTHKRGPGRLPVHELSSVLTVPDEPGTYALGPDRQTLRRQARKAERAGVTWSPVDEADREALLAQATDRERHHPSEVYRTTGEGLRRLLEYRLWLVARDADGGPLLLSVTPTSGSWAALTYFRTLVDDPAATAARYLMTRVLADELAARGVRHLADSSSPIGLPNGLRHFQRMLGYRIHRVTEAPSASTR